MKSNDGIGLSGAFLLLFVGLKLGRVIDWPWLWVISPLWIPLAAFLIFAFVLLCFSVVAHLVSHKS